MLFGFQDPFANCLILLSDNHLRLDSRCGGGMEGYLGDGPVARVHLLFMGILLISLQHKHHK